MTFEETRAVLAQLGSWRYDEYPALDGSSQTCVAIVPVARRPREGVPTFPCAVEGMVELRVQVAAQPGATHGEKLLAARDVVTLQVGAYLGRTPEALSSELSSEPGRHELVI